MENLQNLTLPELLAALQQTRKRLEDAPTGEREEIYSELDALGRQIASLQAKLVAELREKTGLGLMKCKGILQDNGWSVEESIKMLLRQPPDRRYQW